MFSRVGRKLTAELLLLHRKNANDVTGMRASIASQQAQINTLTAQISDATERIKALEAK